MTAGGTNPAGKGGRSFSLEWAVFWGAGSEYSEYSDYSEYSEYSDGSE